MQILVILLYCLAEDNKVAQLLFCLLDLLFWYILIAVTVVVCLRSLIKTLGRLVVLQDNTFNYKVAIRPQRIFLKWLSSEGCKVP